MRVLLLLSFLLNYPAIEIALMHFILLACVIFVSKLVGSLYFIGSEVHYEVVRTV